MTRHRATHDRAADAAYFALAPRRKAGAAVRQDVHHVAGRGEVILDFDRKGRLIGVEVLGAKSLLRRSTLKRAKRLS
jgi:uncharacterized protein YuzE